MHCALVRIYPYYGPQRVNSFYVDDCVSSLESAESAEQFQEFSCSVLAEAGMELRKWRLSNDSTSAATGKVLGVAWSSTDDTLSLSHSDTVSTPKAWTRRTLLKCVAATFDPLGLVSPAVLTGKMLLQEAWKEQGKWDDLLPAPLAQRIATWWGALAVCCVSTYTLHAVSHAAHQSQPAGMDTCRVRP